MSEEKLAAGGAMLAALAASLCCIGPLLFVLLGLGTFGAAAALGAARPYMLGAAVLALVAGFYFTYFRREQACPPGEACSTKRASRAGRVGIWIASLMVIAFALSPYYAGTLSRHLTTSAATPSAASSNAQPQTTQAIFKVSGMTCAGCEMTIRAALERMPGVRSAEVSYDRGEAVVVYDPNLTTPERLREAIDETGYKVIQ